MANPTGPATVRTGAKAPNDAPIPAMPRPDSPPVAATAPSPAPAISPPALPIPPPNAPPNMPPIPAPSPIGAAAASAPPNRPTGATGGAGTTVPPVCIRGGCDSTVDDAAADASDADETGVAAGVASHLIGC